MSNIIELTHRDPDQTSQYEHDEKNNAKRVVVVGQEVNIDSSKIAESLEKAVKEGMANFVIPANSSTLIEYKTLNIPTPITVIEYKTIEVPVIVKEYEKIEIPFPVIEYKIMEVPKTVIEYKEIEKPVYVTTYEKIEIEKQYPLWFKICMALQTIVFVGLLISRFK